MTAYELLTHLPDLTSAEAELRRSPPFKPFGSVEAKVLALARWFKQSYMTWVDPIKCPQCGEKTQSAGGISPDDIERQDGAGRVELHVCIGPDGPGIGCGGIRRFARYNDVKTLLRTREGRCGEW
jgi:peptide-N4-(N-acetyl-beta-glucosaminyl)asparagine amidase